MTVPDGEAARGSRTRRLRLRGMGRYRVPLAVAGSTLLVAAVALGAAVTIPRTQPAGAVAAQPSDAWRSAAGGPPSGAAGVPPAPVPPAPDGPPAAAGPWTQVFADEFNGTALDRSKWRANRYGGNGVDGPFNPAHEGAYYSPRNVSVRDGSAVLELRPEPRVVDGVRYTYSSGMISSQGSFAVRDGSYVEARVHIPIGPGVWPAFWTMPDDRWPPETDIFEYFDTIRRQQPYFIYHFPSPNGQDGRLSVSTYGDPAVDYRNSWHTFGMLRSAGRLMPYLDGVPYPAAAVPAGADDLPQFLMLNLAMYAGGTPAPGTSMLIDWVRVWQQLPGAAPGSPAGG